MKGEMIFCRNNFLFVVLFFSIFSYSCEQVQKNESHKDVSSASILKGKKLAAQYCASCHLLPDPAWADSKKWEQGILPNMGPRLGVFSFKGENYNAYRYDLSVKNVFPEKPLVSEEDWQHIMDYYGSVSPDTLLDAQQRPVPIAKNTNQFYAVPSPVNYPDAGITYVGVDTSGKQVHLVFAGARTKQIYRIQQGLAHVDSISTVGPVVDMCNDAGHWYACDIGVLNPNNGAYGSIKEITKNAQGAFVDTTIVFDKLRRPVHVSVADLNNDGLKDFMVCEFGFLQGSFSWMENKGNGRYDKHVLRPLPGAITSYVDDYNHDGKKDIWALFAQGEEGIFLFTNEGNGSFSSKEVIRFPSIYGSSYFEMHDFNNDGYPDILYTCGDNADYSAELKPYHGMYIYLNDGKNNFTQKYFYPIHGCYKAIAKDFDHDGDLDIATISFFADYAKQPEEGFVYFKNNGNFNFEASSLPATQNGRWLTMATGDIDNDGYEDIILGNFSLIGSLTQSAIDWRTQPPVLILMNKGNK